MDHPTFIYKTIKKNLLEYIMLRFEGLKFSCTSSYVIKDSCKGPVSEILVLIKYAQKHSLNAHDVFLSGLEV